MRVRSLALELSGEDGTKLSLPAQSFSRADGSPGNFLFTSFSLEPDKEWANYIGFFAPVSMNDERTWKQLAKELKADITVKLQGQPQESRNAGEYVEGDPGCVRKLLEFFRKHNKWKPGEYSAVLHLECDPARASRKRKFRFTLFEADIQELEERTSRYKYGAGVYFVDTEQAEVYPRIKDVE